MSLRSETTLKEAVFQLINHHQNIDNLLTEATSLISQNTDGHVKEEYIDILKSCINGQENVTDASGGFHTTETYTSKILKIICLKGAETNRYVTTLTQAQKDELFVIVTAIKDLMKEHCFNKPRFLNIMCKEGCLPLELLWLFETEGVMSLQTYMSFKHSNMEFVKVMSEELTKICCLKTNELTSTFRTDVVNKIVELAFPEKTDAEHSSLRKVALGILDATVKSLLDLLLTGTDSVLLPVYRGQIMDVNTVKKSYLHILSVIMGHQPGIGIFEAFKCQNKWLYAKSATGLVEWNKLLLLPFDDKETLSIIKNAIDRQDVNWKSFLCFLSTYLICEEKASDLIEGLVVDLLKDGFDNSEMGKVEVGFLLGRHCCLEGPHAFMTYGDWFQIVFGDSIKSPVNNRKSFTLLIRFLTELVPIDMPEFLRVHILRPPHVPAKCRELLSDYIILAKTRLSDLKQPFDNLGVYEDTVDPKDKQKMLDQLEKDIQKALNTFETSGKIPTSVMEASIFRKPYFVGRFLPALLKPRPLPDIADLRMKFIKALRSVDKIPVAMYNTYKTACKQEASKLLEGVFMEIDDDDDVEEEMNLEPIQQLHYRLDQLIDVVFSLVTNGDTKQMKVTELVSLIREKIKTIVEKQESDQTVSCDSHVIISPLTMETDKTNIQVIDAILNLFCKLTEACLQSENPYLDWAYQLVDVISEFKILHSAFFTRIWKLVTEQGHLLDSHHVAGLAAIILIVSVNKEKEFGLLEVKVCDSSQHLRGQWTLAEHVWSYLPFHSDKWIQFTFRLTTVYLQLVFSCYDEATLTDILQNKIPSQLIKTFVFLCWRLVPEIREKSSKCSSNIKDAAIAHKIYNSEMFQSCVQLNKLLFEDWIKYELAIHTEADILRDEERQEYIYWCIYNKFMKLSPDDGGCCHDYRRASSILFKCILNAETSVKSSSWSGCPKCKQENIMQGSVIIKTTFIPVLQEMCCFLDVDCDKDGDRQSEYPWLLQQMLNINAPKNENCISYQSVVRTFSRLCTRLPSYLFYCDSLTHIDRKQSLLSCNIINQHFRQYLTQGCCLPSNITVYLLQGLVNCCRHTNIADVLRESPLFILSILFHVPQTVTFIDQLIKIVDDDVTLTLKSLVNWIQDFSLETNVDLPDITGTHWIISAAALFSVSIHSTRRGSEVIKKMITKYDTRTGYREVLCLFASLITTHISDISSNITSSDILQDLEDLLYMVIFDCPSLLCNAITDGLSEVSKVVSDYLYKLHHFTLLRLLSSRDPQRVLELNNSIDCLLLMLAEVCKLYDEIGSEKLETDLRDQVLTMKSLIEMSRFVKQCIMMCDLQVLHQINKEHLTACGPDLILAIKQRLQQ